MRNHNFRKKSVIVLGLVALWATVWMGCSSTVKEKRPETVKIEDSGVGKYYFFDDILVPRELTYKPSKSFIYETPQLKTGSMVFSKFWLDAGSVMDFFVYHMEKDNWKLINSYRGEESILNFTKPDKTCTIKVVEKWYGTTEVEIRVGPIGAK